MRRSHVVVACCVAFFATGVTGAVLHDGLLLVLSLVLFFVIGMLRYILPN